VRHPVALQALKTSFSLFVGTVHINFYDNLNDNVVENKIPYNFIVVNLS